MSQSDLSYEVNQSEVEEVSLLSCEVKQDQSEVEESHQECLQLLQEVSPES